MKISKKITAGVLSLLSLGSSINSASAGSESKLGMSSGKSTSNTVKASNSKSKLKKILLGAGGTAAAGGGVIATGLLLYLAGKHLSSLKNKPGPDRHDYPFGQFNSLNNFDPNSFECFGQEPTDIQQDDSQSGPVELSGTERERMREIFDNHLKNTDVISIIEGDKVRFYWKDAETGNFKAVSRPKMPEELATRIFNQCNFKGKMEKCARHQVERLLNLGFPEYVRTLYKRKKKEVLERGQRMLPPLNDSFQSNFASLQAIKDIYWLTSRPIYNWNMNTFPKYDRWEKIFNSIELYINKGKTDFFDIMVDIMWHSGEFFYAGWLFDSCESASEDKFLFAMVFYPEIFENYEDSFEDILPEFLK